MTNPITVTLSASAAAKLVALLARTAAIERTAADDGAAVVRMAPMDESQRAEIRMQIDDQHHCAATYERWAGQIREHLARRRAGSGASRLWEFSEILDVPVSFFFDDMPEHLVRAEATRRGDLPTPETPAAPGGDDALARRETLELVRAYYRIDSPQVRKRVFELAKSLARMGEDDPDGEG